MSRSRAAASSLVVLSAVALIGPSGAFAQEAGDLEMAQFQFAGVTNTDNVFVRSGASESDYPILKLNRGARVVVVGQKFDWLKILPPEGSFCLVGKAWVNRRGDGSVGRVREDGNNIVNVRVGSTLNPMISKVALQLKGGEDVKIVGEQDEYLKIAPPSGTFVYVHKKFVDPAERVDVINDNGKLVVKPAEDTKGGQASNTGGSDTIIPQPAPQPNGNLAPDRSAAVTPPPTTAPAAEVAAAQTKFDDLEKKLDAATKMPIDEQPVDELLAGYKGLAENKKLPESMLRSVDFRVKGLTNQKKAVEQYNEVKKMRAEMEAKAKPLAAEQQEIAERLKTTQVTRYTAVGTLQSSALQFGSRKMYRLTDPASGRTVVYVVSDDPAIVRNLGAFIGVRGVVTDDTARRVKYIEPTELEGVEPTAVTQGRVSSTLTPASLMPTAAGN